jgi:hypothetical protein
MQTDRHGRAGIDSAKGKGPAAVITRAGARAIRRGLVRTWSALGSLIAHTRAGFGLHLDSAKGKGPAAVITRGPERCEGGVRTRSRSSNSGISEHSVGGHDPEQETSLIFEPHPSHAGVVGGCSDCRVAS